MATCGQWRRPLQGALSAPRALGSAHCLLLRAVYCRHENGRQHGWFCYFQLLTQGPAQKQILTEFREREREGRKRGGGGMEGRRESRVATDTEGELLPAEITKALGTKPLLRRHPHSLLPLLRRWLRCLGQWVPRGWAEQPCPASPARIPLLGLRDSGPFSPAPSSPHPP